MPSRSVQRILAAALCCFALQVRAEGPVPLQQTIGQSQAVAFMRVTRVSEELHGKTVRRTITFSLCGRSFGLGGLKEITVPIDAPEKPDTDTVNPPPPMGGRYVLLLALKDERWEMAARLTISEDGKLAEAGIGEDIGLKPGADADAVVRVIARLLPRPDRASRPKQPPTARNQPWNLMRSSPLRRVWPFFPR